MTIYCKFLHIVRKSGELMYMAGISPIGLRGGQRLVLFLLAFELMAMQPRMNHRTPRTREESEGGVADKQVSLKKHCTQGQARYDDVRFRRSICADVPAHDSGSLS